MQLHPSWRPSIRFFSESRFKRYLGSWAYYKSSGAKCLKRFCEGYRILVRGPQTKKFCQLSVEVWSYAAAPLLKDLNGFFENPNSKGTSAVEIITNTSGQNTWNMCVKYILQVRMNPKQRSLVRLAWRDDPMPLHPPNPPKRPWRDFSESRLF